jgi:hypothetical protein
VCAVAAFAGTVNTNHPLASARPAPSDTRPKPAPAIKPIALESAPGPYPSTVDGTRAEIKAGQPVNTPDSLNRFRAPIERSRWRGS